MVDLRDMWEPMGSGSEDQGRSEEGESQGGASGRSSCSSTADILYREAFNSTATWNGMVEHFALGMDFDAFREDLRYSSLVTIHPCNDRVATPDIVGSDACRVALVGREW